MEFNPFTPEFRDNPYPAYAELRAQGPVVHFPAGNAYVVSHYDAVAEMLRQPNIFSSTAMDIQIANQQTRTVINTDPPDHTKLRNLVNRAFTPRMVAAMEPRIREIVRRLLDDALPAGEMDLIAALAMPLPVTVIAEVLGVDADRREDFKRWSTASITSQDLLPPDAQATRQADVDEFEAYFRDVIDQRRASPSDDLISSLIAAQEEHYRLTPDEMVAFVGLLLIAGNETTTNLIGNGVLALIDAPEQLSKVACDASLVPGMVEEALRFDAPVQMLFRQTTADVELAGVRLPADTVVIPLFASANRDERRYPEPDRFDVTRNAQGHMAFGHGVHFCLGAPLARLEARIAFEELLPRVRDLQRLPGPIERVPSFFLRGPRRLDVTFTPVEAAVS